MITIYVYLGIHIYTLMSRLWIGYSLDESADYSGKSSLKKVPLVAFPC